MKEQDLGWDGGWEDAVDSGQGLGDLMLGPVHPYDRNDGYTPAPRWATRTSLGLEANESEVPDHHRSPGVSKPSHSPKPGQRPPKKRRPGKKGSAPRSGRDAATAKALGVSVERVHQLRREHQAVTNRRAITRLPKPERNARVAAELGLTVGELVRFRQAESVSGGPARAQGATPLGGNAPPRRWDDLVRRYNELNERGQLSGTAVQRLNQTCAIVGITPKEANRLRKASTLPASAKRLSVKTPTRLRSVAGGRSSAAGRRRSMARSKTARRLGLTEQQVSAALGVGSANGRAATRSRMGEAGKLGLDRAAVAQVQRVYLRALEATPVERDEASSQFSSLGSRLKLNVDDHVAAAGVCQSCGVPVSVNGFCGCS